MAPAGEGGGGEPTGALADAIRKAFGDVAKFKEQLGTAATSHFGSGWAWLTLANGKLEVASRPNQDSPLMDNKDADPRSGCVGARLLPQIPEPPAGLRDGLVETW